MTSVDTLQVTLALECGAFRVALEPDAITGKWGLVVAVREGEAWRAITAGVNPFVRGRSFNLLADAVEQQGPHTLLVRGQGHAQSAAGPTDYAWHGTLTSDPATGWVRVEIEADMPEALALQMHEGYEPEITLDLGPLPPYERGDHVWFKTLIANPTKWNDEAFGNDMPATYYCDPNAHFEMMMFFDMTAMDWMGYDNIARFMNYRCGWRRRYRPEPAAELGLYADGFSGTHLRSGKVRFAYALRAAARQQPPTDQQALELLVEHCLPLLPRDTDWPQGATSWRDFSEHCLADLNDPACWRSDERGEFILNYVNGHSPAWAEAIAARGQQFDMIHPCLDSALWLLRPLVVWRRQAPSPELDAFTERLLAMLDRMVAANGIGFLNPPRAGEMHGCWQYVYMLAELWHIARSEGRPEVESRVTAELRERTMPLARACGYVFPLCFDRHTLAKRGSGDGHGIAGLYAELMLDLHVAYGDSAFLDEARLALRTLYHLPVNTINQEIFLTAHGSHAAARLARIDGGEFWPQVACYLQAQTLRMMYWFRDNTTPDARAVNSLGTFQACCSIIYSAIFENIEVLARMAPSLRQGGDLEPLLRVYNLARKTNFCYFAQCLPEAWHSSPLKYIPQENIPILEGPPPGIVGQEIYGAGWTFRAHLLWDAWGTVEDRELMLLNLDAYEEDALLAGSTSPEFILYNPTTSPRTARLRFTLPRDWSGLEVSAPVDDDGGNAHPSTIARGEDGSVTLQAPPGWLRLRVK